MPANKCTDLFAICAWAATMAGVVALSSDPVVRLIFAAPLVLLLTGHCVLRALRPIATSLPEHIAYAVGASVAVAVSGGFLLNWLGLLTPLGWAGWSLVVTAASTLIAARRDCPVEPYLAPLQLPELRPRHIAQIGAAIVIAVGAYGLDVRAAARQQQFKYVDFWIVPSATGAPGAFVVGIKSGEPRPRRFDVEIERKGRIIALWRSVAVPPGRTWTGNVSVALDPQHQQKIAARLYGHDDRTLYRRVSAVVPPA